ncbi:MAG: TerC family protein, partial [Alphaproteobacteria bacterium]
MITGPELIAFLQIVLIDVSLAGDNAIIVGMAAAGLPVEKRKQAVMVGIVAATVLRIIFALFAVQLLKVTGLLAAGGLLLLWVSWKMYQEIRL